MAIFDCKNGATPVNVRHDWLRVLLSDRKNDGNNLLFRVLMAINRQIKNTIISPVMGSCGRLVTIQPSTVHPTSYLQINLRGSYEDVDYTNPSYHLYPSEKYNVRATMEAIGATTNTSTRSWNLNINVNRDQGHLENNVDIILMRKAPNEKNLMICLDYQKSYPAPPKDPLKLGVTRDVTHTKFMIRAAHTNDNTCSRDEATVMATIQGELSDEQKDQFQRNTIHTGGCMRDIKDPRYANSKDIIPKTLNCLRDTIEYTTLRKYLIHAVYDKIPKEIVSGMQYLEDAMRSLLLPNLIYNDHRAKTGNLIMNITVPMRNNDVDVSVITPERGYELRDINFETSLFDGFGPIVTQPWKWPLDNARFSIPFLSKFMDDSLKICSVYPEIVLTGDGGNVPYTITDRWTLVSGDHVNNTFAIFAKKIGRVMAVKVYAKDHVVEIVPSSDDLLGPQVTIDEQAPEQLNNGIQVPNDPKLWIIKVTRYHDHAVVQFRDTDHVGWKIPIMLAHSLNHVALAIETELQGEISGLCGHLDGTYIKNIPKSYTIDAN